MLRAYEAKRDLGAELLESVKQIKAGKTLVVRSPAITQTSSKTVLAAAGKG
jgi:hypothetical protein